MTHSSSKPPSSGKPEDDASGGASGTWDEVKAVGSRDPVISRYAAQVLGLKPKISVEKPKDGPSKG